METSKLQESESHATNGKDAPPALSPQESELAKQDIKKLLAEGRNTREVLVDFKAAVETGSYNGSKMMALAKGLAFLEAILAQNQAHIATLQALSLKDHPPS